VNNRGYTLIELSVVVLLIGMMLLLAIPRLRDDLLNDELKAAARQWVGAVRELRLESVREQSDYILHIDIAHPAFWTYPADTTGEKRAELRNQARRLPAGIRIVSVRQAQEAAKTDGEVLVRFFRRGYVAPTVIRLAKDDRTFTLVLNPFIQAVTVYEKDVDFAFNEEDRAASF
jgi:prepilin-type N-terminal cleavage/methylation domain-containing protein